MDSRKLILFIVLSLGILLLWEKYINPEAKPTDSQVSSQSGTAAIATVSNTNQMVVDSNGSKLQTGQLITVTTNVMQAQISTVGGDIRSIDLLTHASQDNIKQPYKLLQNDSDKIFIAQTGLVSNSGIQLPNHHTTYTTNSYNYVLQPNQDSLIVSLTANESGVDVIKTYTFKRDSYIVDIGYQIANTNANPLTGVSAYWSLLRDEATPEGETKFVHTFTGPAYFTDETKFETLKFEKVAKSDGSLQDINTTNGWVGYIQHYFTVMWLLNANNHAAVCSNGIACRLSFKPMGNNLISAGLLTDLPVIAPHTTFALNVPLFVGPEAFNVLAAAAPHLELTKDYGWVYIFATPLFWLLVKLFDFVHNWGYAIILLTLLVKVVLYPLTRASYISMAKMKALAPKLEKLKAEHGDDKVKLQSAMMQLYKSEKVNPIGGCLPMILQIPVFIGLYWALLSSVELRQAQFLWIHDLSTPDPYYILPVILAATMFLQTFLNPAPTDPVQAKMMRIMPMAFSVMFFFFPAGLVLYWLVNNILSMAQQWYVNNHVTLKRQNLLKK